VSFILTLRIIWKRFALKNNAEIKG